MAVITLSRQFGSGGDEIVEKLCQITGYSLLDKRILEKAAVEAGISDQEIVDYSEANYKVKNLLERLFGINRPVARVSVWSEDTDGLRSQSQLVLSEEHALVLVRKAVEMAYQAGNIIVVGRGGQAILKNRPGALHVRVISGFEDRIIRTRRDPRLANVQFSDSVEARRAAQDLMLKHDEASAEYLQRFHNINWDDPYLYHLIVNTSKVSIENAARAIAELARQLEPMAV